MAMETPAPTPAREITQIAVTFEHDTASVVIVALMSDGTIWHKYLKDDEDWEQVPPPA